MSVFSDIEIQQKKNWYIKALATRVAIVYTMRCEHAVQNAQGRILFNHRLFPEEWKQDKVSQVTSRRRFRFFIFQQTRTYIDKQTNTYTFMSVRDILTLTAYIAYHTLLLASSVPYRVFIQQPHLQAYSYLIDKKKMDVIIIIIISTIL